MAPASRTAGAKGGRDGRCILTRPIPVRRASTARRPEHRAPARAGAGADGAQSPDGLVAGTYCHGMLSSGPLRSALLVRIGVGSHGADHGARVDAALDDIAAVLEQALDIDGLVALTGAGA